MSTTIKAGWLKDKDGNRFAPKTLSSQIITDDGNTLDDKLSNALESVENNINDTISEHINDVVKHITSEERNDWNDAKSHANSIHAPSNAEKNIIIGIQKNGVDLTVDSNTRKVNITVPTTPGDIGLGNVENKSSAAIRSEITKDNVVGALGYDPAEETGTKVSKSGDTMSGYLNFEKDVNGTVHKASIGASSNGNTYIQHYTNGTLDNYITLSGSASFASKPWSIDSGGTGANTAAGALSNLGLTATATELNYIDGVTSNVQTQINSVQATADSKSIVKIVRWS